MASARRGSSSVLEKVDRRQGVDSTIPLTATILTYKIVQSHVVRVIQSHLLCVNGFVCIVGIRYSSTKRAQP